MVLPPAIMVCRPMGMRLMSSARPAMAAASIASSCEYASAPQMQSRIEPVNGWAFCSTTPHWRRTAPWSRAARSWPSYRTLPEAGRSKPMSSRSSVDLPQPLGPTIATNSSGPTRRETSSRTSGPSSE